MQIKHRWTGAVLFDGDVADLCGADLREADLRRADLREAHLYGADLRRANLSEANLSGANLSGANLSGANLYRANLSEANLSGANLSGANLSGANLSGANLSWAYLARAYLSGANLSGANLSGANLSGANLTEASLYGANLTDARGLEQQRIVPEGAIVGWKKTRAGVVELAIPRSAARVNAYGSRKCRAEYAVVVTAPEGAVSMHDGKTTYAVGQTVRPDSYDPDPRVECSHGIHFFITREEAEEYL
jgi:hypothetical protein